MNSHDIFPHVTVILPVLNEADSIRPCLEAVLAQDYPPERMEILVIDGDSTDNSRQIIANFATQFQSPIIRLLDNPHRTTPASLNIGIRQAQGVYIIRVDARTIIAPDYVRQCVTLLEKSGVANVGGRMQPVGPTYIGQAVALATTSRFGIGNSRFHYDDREQFVDTVYMGAFRRTALDEVGPFDETLIRNQDYELNVRIRQAGYKILLSPVIQSTYTPRSSIRALWRQYFQYGRWKVRTLQKHPASLQWRQTVAPLFVVALIGSLLLIVIWAPAWWLLTFVLASYLLANLVASTIAAVGGNWRYWPVLPLVFATIHLAWGLGFWYGLWLALLRRN